MFSQMSIIRSSISEKYVSAIKRSRFAVIFCVICRSLSREKSSSFIYIYRERLCYRDIYIVTHSLECYSERRGKKDDCPCAVYGICNDHVIICVWQPIQPTQYSTDWICLRSNFKQNTVESSLMCST